MRLSDRVFSIALAFFALAGAVRADTVELVTYYPSTVGGGEAEFDRFHAGRATVGNPYSLQDPQNADLPNGMLLAAGPVGIGTVFNAQEPAGVLHVVGQAGQADSVVFMPGAGGSINVGIGTVPDSQNGGTSVTPYVLHLRKDQDNATRVMVENRGATGWAHSQVGVMNNSGWIGYIGAMNTNFPIVQAQDTFMVASRQGKPLVLSAEEAAGDIRFFTQLTGAMLNNPAVEKMRITPTGNVGIGTAEPQSSAPNGETTGNLDVNDVWLRGSNRWASEYIVFSDALHNRSLSFSTNSTSWVTIPASEKTVTVPAGLALINWYVSGFTPSLRAAGSFTIHHVRPVIGPVAHPDSLFLIHQAINYHNRLSGSWLTPVDAGTISVRLEVHRATTSDGSFQQDTGDHVGWTLVVFPD